MGEIYDWDAPGVLFYAVPLNSIYRLRANFKVFATYSGVRCSEVNKWYCVISGKKTGPANDAWSQENSVANDNKVVFGSHCNMTWNLQPVTVTGITPNSAPNNGVVNITNLAGTNFVEGAIVKLKMGETEIVATNVTIVSSAKITCSFDLTGKPTGQYDVVVALQNDVDEGKLPNGFTVTEP